MKKWIAMALCLCLAMPGFLSAGAQDAQQDDKLQIISTIFPPYDFVRQIAGDAVEVTMLLPLGSESHSFEPTPQDIIRIQNCDVFLYIGGETDAWVDRILGSMSLENTLVLPLLDMVDTVGEEIIEGMEHGHDHSHDEVDPDQIHDRPLSDWDGEWASIAPLAAQGALDAYLAPLAEAEDTSLEAVKAAQAERWQSDFDAFTVDGTAVSIGGQSAQYAYQGYALVEGEHGASVWYQYALAAPAEGMPACLAFSDHGTGGEETEHAEDDHGAHAQEAHTHLRYGDDGFAALLDAEGWSPFFVDAHASADDVLSILTGHSHAEEEVELDEHVWTSPKNAKTIVNTLAETLSTLDPDNAPAFRERAAAYGLELDALDQAFAEVVAGAARTTLVFGDRFPFRYFADAYGLDYYAAFPGCATETEASASTIAFLIDKVRAEEIPVVFSIEFSNGRIADAIAESTGAARLEMHSCHNVSKKDFDNGADYLSLMWTNVDRLKEALY